MLYDNHPSLEIEVHNTLVQASCKMLTAVRQVLRPTPMPGRTHYLFTLKDIVTCFQASTSSLLCMLFNTLLQIILFERPYWPLITRFISQLKAIWLSTKILIKIRT